MDYVVKQFRLHKYNGIIIPQSKRFVKDLYVFFEIFLFKNRI